MAAPEQSGPFQTDLNMIKKPSFWAALALLTFSAVAITGCSGGADNADQKTMVDDGNKGLPKDDGKGQGLVSPVRPTMPMKGKH